MKQQRLPEHYYQRIEDQLYERIGRELRLAFRVLDIGCGSCRLTGYLRERYGQRVTGVDIVGERLPKRSGRKSRSSFRCITADAAQMDFLKDTSIDATVMMWALHEMDDAPGALKEAYRVIRPGGEILVVDFPRGSLAQRLWNENYFAPSEVKHLLERTGFIEVKSKTIARKQVIWASGHREPA